MKLPGEAKQITVDEAGKPLIVTRSGEVMWPEEGCTIKVPLEAVPLEVKASEADIKEVVSEETVTKKVQLTETKPTQAPVPKSPESSICKLPHSP